jgi:hypothetical protein
MQGPAVVPDVGPAAAIAGAQALDLALNIAVCGGEATRSPILKLGDGDRGVGAGARMAWAAPRAMRPW